MADWFKFYEDAVDEPKLASAIQELPEILSVLVLLRSRHCKAKSGKLSWSNDEYEVRGLARKINCDQNKFIKALILLQKIHYFSIQEGMIIDLFWEESQSDYCQRKTRQQNQKKPDNVPTVSEQSPDEVPLEEKRVEKKTGEEHTRHAGAKPPPPSEPSAKPSQLPTTGHKPRDLAECLARAQMVGMAEEDAKAWYRDCEACGWRDGENVPIRNWVKNMCAKRDRLQQDRAKYPKGNGGISPNVEHISLQKELERVEEKMRKLRESYGEHQDWSAEDYKKFNDLKEQRKNLMNKLGWKT